MSKQHSVCRWKRAIHWTYKPPRSKLSSLSISAPCSASSPPPRTSNPSTDIPSLTNKIILITGGTAGIGKETALQLAHHSPAHLYLTARNPLRAEAAIRDIKAVVGADANITFLPLDLADLGSVKKASKRFLAAEERLDLLVNNAGIMGQEAGVTVDGFEKQFGTNHMGHALLTRLLLPVMQRTAASSSSFSLSQQQQEKEATDVRIITVSSSGHSNGPPEGIIFSTLKTPMESHNTFFRYGQSKAANILFAAELSRRYPAITSVSCHPGIIDTELSTPFKTGNGLKGIGFGLVVKLGLPEDEALGKKLWEWTERELGSRGY
ncbi:MAG: hypothetical protein Q9220_001540 [cf. Caloplaca sp. 1 TL-2023]